MSVEVSRLSNGMTVATETLPHVETVAMGVWVKSGARDERDDEHGIAHLLEHMAFKGTSRRSAWQIASQIEDVGGEINAATSVETTSFYARVLRDDMPLAIDILADILSDSRFDAGELEREQHVILQEIGAAHDTPDDIVFDRFTETAFRNQTIGRSILGTPETVKSFTSKDLHDFMGRQYAADRMVAVAAGAVKHDEFVREVEKRLGTFRARSDSVPPPIASYVGGDFREYRDLMDAQFILGFEGRAYHVRDFYASQLLSMILGGGMSSRLFQELREERGLAYSIYAWTQGFTETGLFGVNLSTDKARAGEAMALARDTVARAADDLTDAELNRARAQVEAGLLMALETPQGRADSIARSIEIFGRIMTLDEMLAELRAVDAAAARAAGQAMLAGPRAMASIGGKVALAA